MKLVFGLLLCLPALAAGDSPVFDRGLPQANLNNISGDARSNVRWSGDNGGFVGDDFAIGAPGERWVIDGIRIWTVPGITETSARRLGDLYQDLRLYFGGPEGGLTPVVTAVLSPGSNETGNAKIRVSDATSAGAMLYDDFGTFLRVFQVDFQGLNLPVEGGVKYRFGVWGMGRPIPGKEGKTFQWFNHASNSPLSAARQDGADNAMLLFDAGGRPDGEFNCEGNGWDKSADINVQILAHRAPGEK